MKVEIISLSPFVIRVEGRKIEVNSRVKWCQEELKKLHLLMEKVRNGKCTVEEFEAEVKKLKGRCFQGFLNGLFNL
jgi:hypothetical protein